MGITPNSLTSLATYRIDSQLVYAPVILGQPSGEYKFTFFAPSRARFQRCEIKRNGQVIYRPSISSLPSSIINFTWDGSNSPAGEYELHYIADIESRNESNEPIEDSIIFYHDPNWLQ